jgi:hypothetical protein
MGIETNTLIGLSIACSTILLCIIFSKKRISIVVGDTEIKNPLARAGAVAAAGAFLAMLFWSVGMIAMMIINPILLLIQSL